MTDTEPTGRVRFRWLLEEWGGQYQRLTSWFQLPSPLAHIGRRSSFAAFERVAPGYPKYTAKATGAPEKMTVEVSCDYSSTDTNTWTIGRPGGRQARRSVDVDPRVDTVLLVRPNQVLTATEAAPLIRD